MSDVLSIIYGVTCVIAFFPLTTQVAWYMGDEFSGKDRRPEPVDWVLAALIALCAAPLWLPILLMYAGRRFLFVPPTRVRDRIKREEYEALQRRNAELERELGIGA